MDKRNGQRCPGVAIVGRMVVGKVYLPRVTFWREWGCAPTGVERLLRVVGWRYRHSEIMRRAQRNCCQLEGGQICQWVWRGGRVAGCRIWRKERRRECRKRGMRKNGHTGDRDNPACQGAAPEFAARRQPTVPLKRLGVALVGSVNLMSGPPWWRRSIRSVQWLTDGDEVRLVVIRSASVAW